MLPAAVWWHGCSVPRVQSKSQGKNKVPDICFWPPIRRYLIEHRNGNLRLLLIKCHKEHVYISPSHFKYLVIRHKEAVTFNNLYFTHGMVCRLILCSCSSSRDDFFFFFIRRSRFVQTDTRPHWHPPSPLLRTVGQKMWSLHSVPWDITRAWLSFTVNTQTWQREL